MFIDFYFKYQYKSLFVFFTFLFVFSGVGKNNSNAQTTGVRYDQTKEGFLVFHPIKKDGQGKILPWNHDQPGKAYEDIVYRIWNFWDTMRVDNNGLPYYMNHQVWRPYTPDPRGIGGDQLAMALSSWRLLYQYTGNERIKENMKFIAQYYLTNSLSEPTDAWPNIPYPYNCWVYSGKYDGDMILGLHYTQPDKAGSFAWEVLQLYQMTKQRLFGHKTEDLYLEYAIKIAHTLAEKTQVGDENNSPLPFKVHTKTGEPGDLKDNSGSGKATLRSTYTTNWVPTLMLWQTLIDMQAGDVALYKKAHARLLDWCKKYPVENHKWGPFFEDIPGWSDTQINALTMAEYILLNPELFSKPEQKAEKIFEWVYKKLGNTNWEKYGVRPVNEQTMYQTPGNSHTARQGAVELLFAAYTKDTSGVDAAIRKLNWATYMVDVDGKNCYPNDEVWLTDGYGDYVRHFLKAFKYAPHLAPLGDHIVSTNSVIAQVDYAPDIRKVLYGYITDAEKNDIKIYYKTYHDKSIEIIRLKAKPSKVTVDWKLIGENLSSENSFWQWQPLQQGGLLKIIKNGHEVKIFY